MPNTKAPFVVAILCIASATGCSDSSSKGGGELPDAGDASTGGGDGDNVIVNPTGDGDGDGDDTGTSCPEGFLDCDEDVATGTDGCEVDINTLENCGGCGVACEVTNADGACGAGVCELGNCASGYADCDLDSANGCEVDLSSKTNCGSCAVDCGLGDCMAGLCTSPECNSAVTLTNECDGDPKNGCETAINTLTDCGNCRVVCALDNATETCDDGTCKIVDCEAGFDDCDGDPTNGCETPLTTKDDCGGCDVLCGFVNAAAMCDSGICEPVVDGNGDPVCADGFGDCDDDLPTNGCETLLKSLNDCGACGQACAYDNATANCDTGSCTFVACEPDFVDVDQDVSQSCECPDDQTLGGTNCENASTISPVLLDETRVLDGKIAISTRSDWYEVTMPSANRRGRSATIEFTSNPGNAFVMDIYNDCTGSGGEIYSDSSQPVAGCQLNNDVSMAAGIVSWSWTDACAGGGPSGGSLCTTGTPFGDTMPDRFLIKVSRPGNARSCDSYQITITR